MDQVWMIAIFFWAGLWTILWATACGSPLVALWCELRSKISGRSFFDKFAQQMARLGLVSWTIILFSCGIILAGVWLVYPGGLYLPKIRVFDLAGVMIPLFVGLVSFFLYGLFWKKMKKKKGLHIGLGTVSLGCIWLFVYLGLNVKIKIFLQGCPESHNWLSLFQPPRFFFYWPFLLYFFVLSLACTGVVGQLYLVLRRNKDDFGRDYYRFALPQAAVWALFLSVQLIVWGLFYVLSPDKILGSLLDNPLFVGGITMAGAALGLALFIWVIIIRAQSPMRFKGSIVIGNILAWVVVSCAWGIYFGLLSRELDLHLPFVSRLIQGLGLG